MLIHYTRMFPVDTDIRVEMEDIEPCRIVYHFFSNKNRAIKKHSNKKKTYVLEDAQVGMAGKVASRNGKGVSRMDTHHVSFRKMIQSQGYIQWNHEEN